MNLSVRADRKIQKDSVFAERPVGHGATTRHIRNGTASAGQRRLTGLAAQTLRAAGRLLAAFSIFRTALKLGIGLILAWLASAPFERLAAQGTAFTYQGRLESAAGLANGNYDLAFTLFSGNTNGTVLGGPVTNTATLVTNGLFSAVVDFGPGVFTGGSNWLQVAVRTNGTDVFSLLWPRQYLTATPYAITAGGVSGAIPASQITGTLSPAAIGSGALGNTQLVNSAITIIPGAGLTGGGTVALGGSVTLSAINPANLTTINGTNLNPVGTAFTYQGRLNTAGSPANGSFDLAFRLFTTDSGGTAVAGPVTNSAVAVSDGLFVATIDFGAGAFNGGSNWLEVAVRPAGGAGFTTLAPRQPVTPTPYALFANSAEVLSGWVSASQISGSLNAAQLPGSVLTNGATGVTLSGTIAGNGAGLTNVNLATVNGNGALAWLTNAGYTNIVFQMATNATLPAGIFPQSLAAADVNLDGAADLISANAGAGTLTVLTNNGSGSFGFNATLAVGSVPMAVLAVDVNGDGAPDLVSANNYANTLTVLTNNGRGIFGSNATYTVGSGPQGLVAAHVNGTNHWDLVVANAGGNTLTILTNNGRGGFLLATNLPVGNGPVAVAAADFNGDGAVDLASANSTAGTITVWLNNGGGQFVTGTTLVAGNDPQAVVAADLNDDGKPDLIAANFNDSTLTVFLNQGGGAFGSGTVYLAGANPAALVAADVNADGQMDLISTGQGANSLTVLTNNGSGFFSLALTLGTGLSPDALVAADVNGDHLLDLVAANQAGGSLTVFTNASLVTAVTGSPVPVATFSGAFTGSGADLTNISPASIAGGVTINLPVVLTNGHTNILVIVNGIITKIQ